jgi:hypothetical protein
VLANSCTSLVIIILARPLAGLFFGLSIGKVDWDDIVTIVGEWPVWIKGCTHILTLALTTAVLLAF